LQHCAAPQFVNYSIDKNDICAMLVSRWRPAAGRRQWQPASRVGRSRSCNRETRVGWRPRWRSRG
jgi:hypothetical protein